MQPHAYLRNRPLAVYPYLNIYQSGALQLAYAFGKPVLVTNVGALAEIVEDGTNGRVVPPGSIDALADGLCELLSAPSETLCRMGRHSAQLADSRYGWDEIADSTLEVYNRVVREVR